MGVVLQFMLAVPPLHEEKACHHLRQAASSRLSSPAVGRLTTVALVELGYRLRPKRKIGARIVLRLLGFYESRPPIPSSFGEQRSIQLSYGRLFVSIDETPVAGNAPDFARLDVGGGSCGKVRAFESSRARQLLCAVSVAGAFSMPSSSRQIRAYLTRTSRDVCP